MRPERFQRLKDVLQRRQPDLTVVMDRVNKSHNFSAILRSCDAVGVLEVHVVLPDGALELGNAPSAGTKKWIRVHRHRDIADALALLHREGFTVVAAHPGEDAIDYREIDYTASTAILVGAELHGVSDDGLRLADVHVALPMDGMVRSLNVSVATAILLFEARRQRQQAGMYAASRLTPGAFEERLFEWCYPVRARALRAQGRAYPRLGPDGEILT